MASCTDTAGSAPICMVGATRADGAAADRMDTQLTRRPTASGMKAGCVKAAQPILVPIIGPSIHGGL